MGRALQPCGTWAAYKRHKRKGEEPCDACRQAAREQRRGQRDSDREKASAPRLSMVPPVEVGVVVDDPVPDPLEVARDNLVIVEATLRSPMTPGGSIANLTKRREELVDRIRKLSGADVQEVSVLDQLAQRRKDRLAGTAN